MPAVMSNMECAMLTKENLEKAIADIMSNEKWVRHQKEQAKKSINACKIITRCWELFDDESVPDEIKRLAYGLASSTAFNGFPICSKEVKDKLEDWL